MFEYNEIINEHIKEVTLKLGLSFYKKLIFFK